MFHLVKCFCYCCNGLVKDRKLKSLANYFGCFLTSTGKQVDKVQKAETGSTDNSVNSKHVLEKWG